MSLYYSIWLDVLTVTVCAVLLYKMGKPRFLSPAVLYMFFHFWVFTVRAITVQSNGMTLFTDVPGWDSIDPTEIARALHVSDIFLVGLVLGGIAAEKKPAKPVTVFHPLDQKVMTVISLITILVGVMTLLSFAVLPGMNANRLDLGAWNSSSFSVMALPWLGLGILILMYVHGFRQKYMLFFVVYLAIILYQGVGRFRLVLPCVGLLVIYLYRKGIDWPPLRTAVIATLLLLMFYPMKTMGKLLQDGAPIAEYQYAIVNSIIQVSTSNAEDQMLLDEAAAFITAVEFREHYFWGTTYLPLLYTPIPRQLWPGKPALNEWSKEISVPTRPLFEIGATPTLPADIYANVGLLGCPFIGFAFGFISTRFFRHSSASPYLSAERFSYLLFTVVLPQLFRDGLPALLLFPAISFLPFTAVVVIHRWRKAHKLPPSRPPVATPVYARARQ